MGIGGIGNGFGGAMLSAIVRQHDAKPQPMAEMDERSADMTGADDQERVWRGDWIHENLDLPAANSGVSGAGVPLHRRGKRKF